MRPWLGRFRDCRGGASALEFSLILAPMLVLMFGGIEYSRLLWTREALQQAAIAGARCVGMPQTGCSTAGVYNAASATTFIQNAAAAWSIALPASGIAVSTSATCGGVGGFSQVTLTYAFQTVAPTLLPTLSAGSTLTATACFPNG
jgi:Flp pilus assembly protein TadG